MDSDKDDGQLFRSLFCVYNDKLLPLRFKLAYQTLVVDNKIKMARKRGNTRRKIREDALGMVIDECKRR